MHGRQGMPSRDSSYIESASNCSDQDGLVQLVANFNYAFKLGHQAYFYCAL